MRLTQLFMCVTAVLPASALVPANAASEDWRYPIIENYGKVQPVPQAEMTPSLDRRHRVLMDLTEGAGKPGKVGDGLVHVARLVNLYALADVPRDNVDLVAVIHGKSTRGVLKDAVYRSEFGVENPNTPLIEALAEAGVELYVCGQALAHHGFEPKSVHSDISIALSALTALEKFQNQGYVLLP